MSDATPASSSTGTDLVLEEIRAHQETARQFESVAGVVADIASRVIAALERGNKILLFGNGGSAADAQHIAAEFSVRFRTERTALPAIALTTDTSVLTACANDYSFDRVYARQVEALSRPGDVVIGISTSGNSRNVIEGLTQAKTLQCETIGFTGGSGGGLKSLCDLCLIVPSPVTARVQECHILAGHIICEMVDRHWQARAR